MNGKLLFCIWIITSRLTCTSLDYSDASFSLFQVSKKSFSFLPALTPREHYLIIKFHNQRNELNCNHAKTCLCSSTGQTVSTKNSKCQLPWTFLLIKDVSSHSGCLTKHERCIGISRSLQSRGFCHDYVWLAKTVWQQRKQETTRPGASKTFIQHLLTEFVMQHIARHHEWMKKRCIYKIL